MKFNKDQRNKIHAALMGLKRENFIEEWDFNPAVAQEKDCGYPAVEYFGDSFTASIDDMEVEIYLNGKWHVAMSLYLGGYPYEMKLKGISLHSSRISCAVVRRAVIACFGTMMFEAFEN